MAVFKEFLARATPSDAQALDTDFLLALGELFAQVVYAQLILENAEIYPMHADLVEQIFDFMVRDVSRYALQLYSKASSTARQMEMALRMVRKPVFDEARYRRVWAEVVGYNGAYEMQP